MPTKMIRKLFSLGRWHPNKVFFTLPAPWLRFLEEDLFIVPKRILFEITERTLVLKPSVASKAELAGKTQKPVYEIGKARIVEIPRAWYILRSRELGEPLEWVWVRVTDNAIMLEAASKEEHDERRRYLARRGRRATSKAKNARES